MKNNILLASRFGVLLMALLPIGAAARQQTVHFTKISDFEENFRVVSQGKPGFTVETGNMLRMGNTSDAPQHLFAVFTGGRTSGGEGVLSGRRMRVAANFHRLRVPDYGNDRRNFGLALFTVPGENRCYYARILFDLSTVEIGIMNPANGRGWVSLAKADLEGVEDGDRLVFEWAESPGGGASLKAFVSKPNGRSIGSVQVERDPAADGFDRAAGGRAGLGLFGWPASTVAFSRFEVGE